jgi:predicted ATPase/class 3 adenylate cyclase
LASSWGEVCGLRATLRSRRGCPTVRREQALSLRWPGVSTCGVGVLVNVGGLRGRGLTTFRRQETRGADRVSPVAGARSAGLPTGTVTFLFTDIEGSTRLLEELGSERYGAELELHRDRIRCAIAAHGGSEFGTEGDAVFIAFARASDALSAASEVQVALAGGPICVRIGIHTGEPLIVSGDYVGLDVHKAARVCAVAHGGQVLVSLSTRELVGGGLRDLGRYRLKDLTAPERLFQLGTGDFPPLRSLRPTNLPVQPGPLFGRREEIVDLLALARKSRLVTLTGPGGSGKTRLALELTADLSDEYRDGVWWVPLAAVTDPGLVLPAIAQTLGARDGLQEHLAGKRVLLLLDNLEQVVDAVPLIADLLSRLPHLCVIATSRERLAVSFEQEYPVPPLDETAAQELFVSRARELDPGFKSGQAVSELCSRLDRLPLALELASSRVKLMTTEQILSRIERRLDLLTAGRRDAPARQATMRAAIEWSFELLCEPEQALFRGLGVFAGSFELEAAEAVCSTDLDGLQSLTDKSLLRRNAHGRFFLLELTREYAREQLHAAGEGALLRRRHADWYLGLAKRAEARLRSADQGLWLSRLRAETDNFRVVLAWSLEEDLARGVELAATLREPWEMHGQLQELVAWFERALAMPSATNARTRAVGLAAYGDALIFIEQYERAHESLEESLILFRELRDRLSEASVLNRLDVAAWAQGDIQQAIELAEEALAIYREEDDRRGIARALVHIGVDLFEIGNTERGTAALEEARAIYSELDDRSAVAGFLHTLGDLALDRRDPQGAANHYREAGEIALELDDERTEMYCVAGLACVAALQEDAHTAGRRWGAVELAENRLEMRIFAAERVRYERLLSPLEHDRSFRAGYEAARDDLAQAVRELSAT